MPVFNTAGILAALPHQAHLQYHISTVIVTPLPITHVIPHATLPCPCARPAAQKGRARCHFFMFWWYFGSTVSKQYYVLCKVFTGSNNYPFNKKTSQQSIHYSCYQISFLLWKGILVTFISMLCYFSCVRVGVFLEKCLSSHYKYNLTNIIFSPGFSRKYIITVGSQPMGKKAVLSTRGIHLNSLILDSFRSVSLPLQM